MLLAFPMVLIPLILVERIKIIKAKVQSLPYGLGGSLSRTGRGMKSLDSLYRYGFIIMKQISKTKFPPNELRLIQAFQEKHKYINGVFEVYHVRQG